MNTVCPLTIVVRAPRPLVTDKGVASDACDSNRIIPPSSLVLERTSTGKLIRRAKCFWMV